MNDIGSRLRQIRIDKGLKQDQLAQQLGCSSKAISCYENNKNLDKVFDFQKICEYLDADINYLMSGKEYSSGKEITEQEKQILSAYRELSDSDRRIVDYILNMKAEESAKIYRFPIFYQSAAAGIGRLSETEEYHMEEFELKSIPKQAVFGMYIKGHSMETNIYENDVVLINPSVKVCDDLEDEIVVALFGEELICKRFSVNEDDQTYDFISDNPEDKDKGRFHQKRNNFTLVGKVVKIIHAHETGNGLFTYSED